MSEVAVARSLDNHRDLCPVCRRRVLKCFDGKGKPIAVDNVDFGRGRLAITRDLVDSRLIAEPTNQGTSYRLHACPTTAQAFSAASFHRKGGR